MPGGAEEKEAHFTPRNFISLNRFQDLLSKDFPFMLSETWNQSNKMGFCEQG